MAVSDLLREAKNLPAPERVARALAIWDTLEDLPGEPEVEECTTVEIAQRRDAELDAGTEQVLTHDEVMRYARCDAVASKTSPKLPAAGYHLHEATYSTIR